MCIIFTCFLFLHLFDKYFIYFWRGRYSKLLDNFKIVFLFTLHFFIFFLLCIYFFFLSISCHTFYNKYLQVNICMYIHMCSLHEQANYIYKPHYGKYTLFLFLQKVFIKTTIKISKKYKQILHKV